MNREQMGWIENKQQRTDRQVGEIVKEKHQTVENNMYNKRRTAIYQMGL